MKSLYDTKHRAPSADERIAIVAAKQHGVFTRDQAMRYQMTPAHIRWRLRSGRWERLHPRVYRLAGAPRTWRQNALATCLHFGSTTALSYRAAAYLRGIDAFKKPKVEVSVNRNRNISKLNRVIVHRTNDPIPKEDITTIDGIPVTKPARTLLDLCTVEPEDVIERCLDDYLRRKLVSLPFLERWLAGPRRKNHRGAPVLRRLLEVRATTGITDSPLESQVLRLLKESGLPIPMLQYVVEAEGRFIARVDFAYPDRMIAIEADGYRYHDGRTEFDGERARGNELESLGWCVLRVTSKHLQEDPESVVDWVRRALSRAIES
ncbi:MAG: type IV toxin-antitoxin system AbiEi family antitoxin domain-containing protein [Actinomycetota bacterium]